ncbi:hypothetical protein AB0E69_25580, partial [Kribbella sp. NPDC026611]|uniref:hypothetical protein n=1 Tax=Kribbella sp. NPDC026611 TaxID=3154911 RepID=UPI0033D25661
MPPPLTHRPTILTPHLLPRNPLRLLRRRILLTPYPTRPLLQVFPGNSLRLPRGRIVLVPHPTRLRLAHPLPRNPLRIP